MNYKVKLYDNNGSPVFKMQTNAKSYLDAIKKTTASAWLEWKHATVQGKLIRRYDSNYEIIKGAVRYFKSYDGNTPAILMMIGNTPEFHRYYDVRERDKVYAEVTCTDSMSAESANPDKAQTDITVSTEGIKDSESGSTSKKTLSGYATNATCKDLPTRLNTAKSSGKSSVKDMDVPTWKPGSGASLSRPKPMFIFTVKTLKGDDTVSTKEHKDTFFFDIMNRYMGKTLKFEPKFMCPGWFTLHGSTLNFHEQWLDKPTTIRAAVLTPYKKHAHSTNGQQSVFTSGMSVPGIHTFQWDEANHMWVRRGYYYVAQWLDPTAKKTATAKGIKLAKVLPFRKDAISRKTGICAVDSMQDFIGKTIMVKQNKIKSGMFYKLFYTQVVDGIEKGWNFVPEWLDFTHIDATVKIMPTGTTHTGLKGTVEVYKPVAAGKTLSLTLCDCGCGFYQTRKYGYFAGDWLEVPNYGKKITGFKDNPSMASS